MAASAGTLIAAGLESAGYRGQQMILDQLAPVLMGSALALFFFLTGRAIWIYMATGQIRPAMWVLVGPIVLNFLLFTRTVSGGAEWQFGSYKGDPKLVQKFVQGNVSSNVSFAFEIYNRFVSGLSESMIGLVLNNPVSSSVLFTVRQQVYDLIMNVDVVSPGLRSLIHEGLQGKCGEWMNAARKIARGNRDPVYMGTPEYNSAFTTYDTMNTDFRVSLQSEGPSYKYVLELLNSVTAVNSAQGEAQDLIRSMCENADDMLVPAGETPLDVVNAGATCQQLWCWSAIGLVLEAKAALDDSLSQTVEKNPAYDGMSAADKAALLQSILDDIAKKVSPDPDPVTGVRFDNDPSVIPVVIAGKLLQIELARDPKGSLYTDFAESSRVQIQGYQPQVQLSSDELTVLREQNSTYAETAALEAKALALAFSLPYLQGAILYGLAVTFPFFALASLIPRQRSAIFFWAGAWMWAKSWDLGWALVMLVDQVLWEMMPHRAYYEPVSYGVHSPITVLESAFDTDPTYSLATYYAIVAFLLMAVPTVTGQIILRGVSSIGQFLLGGLNQRVVNPSQQIAQDKILGNTGNPGELVTAEQIYNPYGAFLPTDTSSSAVPKDPNTPRYPFTPTNPYAGDN